VDINGYLFLWSIFIFVFKKVKNKIIDMNISVAKQFIPKVVKE